MLGLAAAAAVGGATSGAHPTGTHVIDALYGAALAALVTEASARGRREAWLFLAVVAVVMSRGWLIVPAALALGVAFGASFSRHAHRRDGAFVGALAMQAVLRWPAVGFHGLPTLVAAVAVMPLLLSAYLRSSEGIQRRARMTAGIAGGLLVVLAAPLVISALLSRTPASAAEAEAHAAFAEVADGNSAAATSELHAAAEQFAQASARTGCWCTAGAELIPLVAQERRVLVGAVRAAEQLSAVAAANASQIDYHRLTYGGGRLNLPALAAMAGPMTQVDGELGVATSELEQVRSPWLIGPVQARLSRLTSELNKTKSTADVAVQALGVLPGILGADGPRHYFVAFLDPSESRGLGGLVAGYGELVADQGKLSLGQSGDTTSLESTGIPPAQRTLSGPADYVSRYGQFHPQATPMDVSYSPDLPSVAQVLAQVYPESGGSPIDGVLVLDPFALAALLTITGPIEVPGLPVPMTTANAAQILLLDQYTIYANAGVSNNTRHAYLQDALREAFGRLTGGSLPGPRSLATQMDPMVRQGRLAFWSLHPGEQPLLRRLGLDDSFPQPAPGGDLLAVTTQNVGNNKIDAFLHRSVTDQVSFDPDSGTVSHQVTVTLKNDAPGSGLPPYVINSPSMPNLAPGTNDTWMSIYTPLQFTGVSANGTTTGLSAGKELGVNVYSGYFAVPPGGQVVVTVDLQGSVAPGTAYELGLWLQPMANPDQVSVTVTPTAHWRPTPGGASLVWTPTDRQRQSQVFKFSPS